MDANAKRHGLWQWWSPEDGRLVATETYDSGDRKAVESFYPNGRLLCSTVMTNGKAQEQRFVIDRSQEWIRLLTGQLTIRLESIPISAVEVRKIPNAYPLSYEFFDAEGRKINRLGIVQEGVEALVKAALAPAAEDETASAAVNRFTCFCDAIITAMGTQKAASTDPADAMARWRLRFSKPVDPVDLRAAEERLGGKLPPSYVDFVTQYGLFSGPGEYLKMLPPGDLGTLHDRLLKSYRAKTSKRLAKSLGLDETGIAELKKTVVFSTGQYEELLEVFQLHAADPATGEAPIVSFDPQEGVDALPLPTRKTGGREFDRHVRELVDFNLRELAKWLQADT